MLRRAAARGGSGAGTSRRPGGAAREPVATAIGRAFGRVADEAETTPLARFAAGLRRAIEAVRGAIETPWSTSPVEGQIGRLKMLKRTMYGRAGFALLRQRVLNAA